MSTKYSRRNVLLGAVYAPQWTEDEISRIPASQADIGAVLYPRTAAEIAASVTPTDYGYEFGHIRRYGAVGDGATDDRTAMQAAIAAASGSNLVINNGAYKLNSKAGGNCAPNFIGANKYNSAITSGTFADYVLEFGDGSSVLAQTGRIFNLRLVGNKNNLGIVYLNTSCHLWLLDNLYFAASPCPAIIIESSWDSNYSNIDIIGCCGTSGEPATAASLIIKGDSNNLYFRGMRIERGLRGSIYNEGQAVHFVTGKIDHGFVANQVKAAVTNTSAGLLYLDDFQIVGVSGDQYNIDNAGALILGSVLLLGATGADAHIRDRRTWSVAGSTAASIGPFIPLMKLGNSVFTRTYATWNDTTDAVLYSKIANQRATAKFSVTADNGAVSGNRSVTVNLAMATNDLYNGMYLVHNADGYLASSRRKILVSLSTGKLILKGAAAVTVDADYSIEYAGNHSTPNLTADNITIDNGMTLFTKVATGCTLTGPFTYQTAAGANYGTTTAKLTGVSSGTDLTGLFLVDEVTGEPFYIQFGMSGTTIGVPYDRSTHLSASRTYTVMAGYYAGVKQEGSNYAWDFCGRRHSYRIKALEDAGFDINNVPLWGFTEQPVTTIYSASMTVDARLGDDFKITATNGTAFTINTPIDPSYGQKITISIFNTSGGALGAVTWGGGYKLATWTSPATGFMRAITFIYDGSAWRELNRTAADVPN